MISAYEPPLTPLEKLGYPVPRPETPPWGLPDTLTLTHVCPIPDPCDTAGAFERYHHQDLPALSLVELEHERWCVSYRLALDERPSRWLLGRLDASRRELALRTRHYQSQEVDQPPSDAGAGDSDLPEDHKPDDLSRPYHHPLPGLRTTLRGLHTTLRRL